jgi:hypothetical protein
VVGAAVLLLVAKRRSTLEPGLRAVDITALKTFASTMGPLSVTYICKNLCYILLQTAAASLSMVQLAAHQVRGHGQRCGDGAGGIGRGQGWLGARVYKAAARFSVMLLAVHSSGA